MPDQPTIGRIVHYQSFGTPDGEFLPEPRAAIITAVTPMSVFDPPDVPAVSLAVLNPTGLFFNYMVPFSEKPEPGCWSWPPRV